MTHLSRVLQQVYARAPRGIELGLQRVRSACDALVHPSWQSGVLHVAGTNGKGSVAAISSLALQNAGYQVGLFTSPHLCRFAERIRINQAPVDDTLLTAALNQALRWEPALTFFELSFVAALIAFTNASVDCIVLEVGMGGRLDATNVVDRPTATAVTTIALDHTRALGSTLAEIAHEKACIAKHGVPMILGSIPHSARIEIQRVANERGASPVWTIGEDIDIKHDGHAIDVSLPWGQTKLEPKLQGTHQLQNAAVAAALCCLASKELDRIKREHVVDAVANVAWPARLESIDWQGVEVLLDAAHNPAGIDTLVDYVGRRGVRPHHTALVFGAMQDKAWSEMLDSVSHLASHRFYTAPHGREPADPRQLQAVAAGTVCDNVQSALQLAVDSVGPDGLVIVCGSIFLAAETRALLLNLASDPPVAL